VGQYHGQVLLDAVRAFLEELEWPYNELEENVLVADFASGGLTWSCFAQTLEDDEQFLFYSVPDVEVPPPRRLAVAEYLTRANFGLRIGNWEMDLDSGSIQFRTSVDVEGCGLPRGMIRQLVFANLAITERYLPGVFAVMDGGDDPAAAIGRIEASEAPTGAGGAGDA
jgi:hypothetical protein